MKNRRKICNKLGKSGLLCAMLLVNAGCVDKYLPDEKDAFDRNVAYRVPRSIRLWGISYSIRIYVMLLIPLCR